MPVSDVSSSRDKPPGADPPQFCAAHVTARGCRVCLRPTKKPDELLAARRRNVALLEAWSPAGMTGEPLAWVIGTRPSATSWFTWTGVYVPRWQSEPLARRAVERLPDEGVAIDLCTGSGAIGKTISASRPGRSCDGVRSRRTFRHLRDAATALRPTPGICSAIPAGPCGRHRRGDRGGPLRADPRAAVAAAGHVHIRRHALL